MIRTNSLKGRLKKSISLLLAMLMLPLSLLLSGCGQKQKIDGYIRTENFAYNDIETVMMLSKYEVPFDLYGYFYASHCRDLLIEYETLSSDPEALSAKAAELTEASLRKYFAVIELAKDYEIALTKDTVKELVSLMESEAEKFDSREEYLTALSNGFGTEELYYNLLLTGELESLLFDYMTEEATGVIDSTDATVEKDIRENFYAAVQIFVKAGEEDDPEEKRKLAMSLYGKAVSDPSQFETIADQEGDDKEGVRYFTSGATHKFFEDTVKNLEIDEISSIIESGMGYHIIRRLPLDEGYISKHFEDLRYDYLTRCYNTLVEERGSSLKIEERSSLKEKRDALTVAAMAGS